MHGKPHEKKSHDFALKCLLVCMKIQFEVKCPRQK